MKNKYEMNPCARPGAAFNTCGFGKDELFPVVRDPTATEIRTAKDLHEQLKHIRRMAAPASRAPRRSLRVSTGATRSLTSPTGFGRSRYVWIHNERHMLFNSPQHESGNVPPYSSESVSQNSSTGYCSENVKNHELVNKNKNGRQQMLEKVGDALANVPELLGDPCRTYGYRLCDHRVDGAPCAEFKSLQRDECEEVKKAMEWTPPRLVQPQRCNSHERTPHSYRHHDGASSHFISHFLDDPIVPEGLERSVTHRQTRRDFQEILIARSSEDLSTGTGHGLQCFRFSQSNPFWSHGEASPFCSGEGTSCGQRIPSSPFWSGEVTSCGHRIPSLLGADLSQHPYPVLRDNPVYYPNERSLCGKVKPKQKRDRNSAAYGKMNSTRSLLRDYLLQPREKAMITAFLTLLTTMPDHQANSCSRESDAHRSFLSDNPFTLDSTNKFLESLGNIEIKSLLPASRCQRVGHATKTDASALQVAGTSIPQCAWRNATKVPNVCWSQVNEEFKQTKEIQQQMEHRGLKQVTPLSEASHAVSRYISCLPWYESRLLMQAFYTQKWNNKVKEAETTGLYEGQWLRKVSTSCTLLQGPQTTTRQRNLDSTSCTYGTHVNNEALWSIFTSPTMRTEASRNSFNQKTPSLQTGVKVYSQNDDVFYGTKQTSWSEDSESAVPSESFSKITQLPAMDDSSSKCKSSESTPKAYVSNEDEFTIEKTTVGSRLDYNEATGDTWESGDEDAGRVRISLQEKLAIHEMNSMDGARKSSSPTFQVLLSRSSTESADSESSKESLSVCNELEKCKNEFTDETSEKMNDQYQAVGILKENASLEDASRNSRSSLRVRFNQEEYSNKTTIEADSSFEDLPLVEGKQVPAEDGSFNEMTSKVICPCQDLVTTSSRESLSEISSTASSSDGNIVKKRAVGKPLKKVSHQDEYVRIIKENPLMEKTSRFAKSYARVVFKIQEQECLNKTRKQSSSLIQGKPIVNKNKSTDETSSEENSCVQGIPNINDKSTDEDERNVSHELQDFCSTTSEDSLDEHTKIKNQSMDKLSKQEKHQVQDVLTKDENKSTDISSKVNHRVQNELITRKQEYTDNVPNVDSVTTRSSLLKDKQILSNKEEPGDTVKDDGKHEAVSQLIGSKISNNEKTSTNTHEQPHFPKSNNFYLGREFIVKRSPHSVGPKILRKMRQLFEYSGQLPKRDDKKPGRIEMKSIYDTEQVSNVSKFSCPNLPAIDEKSQSSSSSKEEVTSLRKEEFKEKPLNQFSSCKMVSNVCASPQSPEQAFLKTKEDDTSSEFSILPQVSGHIHQTSSVTDGVTSRNAMFTMEEKQSMNETSRLLTPLFQKTDDDQTVTYGAKSSVKDNSEKPMALGKSIHSDKSIQVNLKDVCTKSRMFESENKPTIAKPSVDESPLSNVKDTIKKWNAIICQDSGRPVLERNTLSAHFKRRFSKLHQIFLERKRLITSKEKVKSKWYLSQEKQEAVDRDGGFIDIHKRIKKIKDNSLNPFGNSISESVILDGHSQYQIHSDEHFPMRIPKAKCGRDKKRLFANKSCSDFYRRQRLDQIVSGESVASPVFALDSNSVSSQSSAQVKTTFPFVSETPTESECSELFPMGRPQYLLSTACQPRRCLSDSIRVSETWLSRKCDESLDESSNDETDSSLQQFLSENYSDELVSNSQSAGVELISSPPLVLSNEKNLQVPCAQSSYTSESHEGKDYNLSSTSTESFEAASLRRKMTKVDLKGGENQISSEKVRRFDYDKNMVIQAVDLFQPPPDGPPKDFLHNRGLDETQAVTVTQKSTHYKQPLSGNFKNDAVKLSPSPLYGCCMAGEWTHLRHGASQETDAQKRSAGILMKSTKMSPSPGTRAASSTDSHPVSGLESNNSGEVTDGRSLHKSLTEGVQQPFEDVATQAARWPRAAGGDKEITFKEGFSVNKPASSTSYSDSDSFHSDVSSVDYSSNGSRRSRTEFPPATYHAMNETSTANEFAAILALDKVILDVERNLRQFSEQSSAFSKRHSKQGFDKPFILDMADSLHKDISEDSNDSSLSLKTAISHETNLSTESTHSNESLKEAGFVVPESEKFANEGKPNESSCLFHTDVEKMKAILLEASRELRKLKEALQDGKLQDEITVLVCGICDALSSAWLAEVSKLPTTRDSDGGSDSHDSSLQCAALAKNEETTKGVDSQLKTNDIITHFSDHLPMNEDLRQRWKKCGSNPLYRGKCESSRNSQGYYDKEITATVLQRNTCSSERHSRKENFSVADECRSSSSSLSVSSQSAPENCKCVGDLYQSVISLFASLQQELQKILKEDRKMSKKSSQGTMAYTIKRKALKVAKNYSQNDWLIKQVLEKRVPDFCPDLCDHQQEKRSKPCVCLQPHTRIPLVSSSEPSTQSCEKYKGTGTSPSSSSGSLFYESTNSSVALPYQNLSGGNCSAESRSDHLYSACNFTHADGLHNTLDKFNSKMVTIKGKINHMLNLINRYNTSFGKDLEGGGTQFRGNSGADDWATCSENNMLLQRERGRNTEVLYIPGNKDEASKTFQFQFAQENLIDAFMLASMLECDTCTHAAVQSLTPGNVLQVQYSQPVIYGRSVITKQYSLTELMTKHSPEVKTSLTKERIRFLAWRWRKWAINHSLKVRIGKGRLFQPTSVNRLFTSPQRGDNSVGLLHDRVENSTATREDRWKCHSSNIFIQPDGTENATKEKDGSLPVLFRTSQLLEAPLSNDLSESEVRESLANKDEHSFTSSEFVDLTRNIETIEIQSSPRRGGKNRVLPKSPPMKDKLLPQSSPMTDDLAEYESPGTMQYGNCFVDVFAKHQGKMPLKSSARDLGSVPLQKDLLVKRRKLLTDTVPRCAYRSRRYLKQSDASANQLDIKRLSISTSHPVMERPQATCADRRKYLRTKHVKTKYLSGSRDRAASSSSSGKELPTKFLHHVNTDHRKTEQSRASCSENLTRDVFKKGIKMFNKPKHLTSDKTQHKRVTLAENVTYLSKKERKVIGNPKHLTNYQKEQDRVGLAENKAHLSRKKSKIASQPEDLTRALSRREHNNSDLSMTDYTNTIRDTKQKSVSYFEQSTKREEKQGFFKEIFQKLRNRLPRRSVPPSEEMEDHAGKTPQESYPLDFDKDFTRFGHTWPLSYPRDSGEMWCAVAHPLVYSPPHSVSIHTHVSNRTSTTTTPSPQRVYPVNPLVPPPSRKKKESAQTISHGSQESIGFQPLTNADDVLNLTFNQSASNATRAEEKGFPAGESPRHRRLVSRRKASSRRSLSSKSPRAAGNVPKRRSVRRFRDDSPRLSINNQSMKIRVSNEDEAITQDITKGWREMHYLPWSSSEEACGKEELMLKFLQECSKWQNKRLHDDVTQRRAAGHLENHQSKDRFNHKDELQSAKPQRLGKDYHRPLCHKQLVKSPDTRQSWKLCTTNLKPRKPGSTQEMRFKTVSGHQTIYVRESEIRRVHSSEPNPHQKSCLGKNPSLPGRQLNTFTVLPEQDSSRMMNNARVKNFMQMSTLSYLGQKRNLAEEGAREFYSFPEELPPTTKRKEFLAEFRPPDLRNHRDDSSATSDIKSGSGNFSLKGTSESYISSSPEVSAIPEKPFHSSILKTSLKGNRKSVRIKQQKDEETEANISWFIEDSSKGFLVEDNSTNMNHNMPVLSESRTDMKTATLSCLRDSEGSECDKEHVISSVDEASAVYMSMCVVDKVQDPTTGHSVFNVSGSGRGANLAKSSDPSRSFGDFFECVKRVKTKRRHRHGTGSPPRRVREHELSPTSGYSSYTFSPISDLQEESQNAIFSSDSFKSLPTSSSSQAGDDDDNAVAVRSGFIRHQAWRAAPPPCRQVPGGRQKQRSGPDAENKKSTKSTRVSQVSNKNVKVVTQAFVLNCPNLGTDPVSETQGVSKTPHDEGVVRDSEGITIVKRSPKTNERYLQHLESIQPGYSGTSLPQTHITTTKPDPRVAGPGVRVVTQATSSSTTFLTFCLGTSSMEKTSIALTPRNTCCNASVNDRTSMNSSKQDLRSFQGRLKNAARNIARSGAKFSPVRQSLSVIKEEADLTRTGVEPSAASKAFDSAKRNGELGASSSVARAKTLDSKVLSETLERPMTVAEKIAFFNQIIKSQPLTLDSSYVRFKERKQEARNTTHDVLSSSTSDHRKTTFSASKSNEGAIIGMPASQKSQNLELNTDNEEHGTSSMGDHADTLDSVGHQRSTLSRFYSQLRTLFTRTSLPPMQSSPHCSQLGECRKDKRATPVSDVLCTSVATSLSSARSRSEACSPLGGITSLSSRTRVKKEPVADSCKMHVKSQMARPPHAELRNQLSDDSSDVATAEEGPRLREVRLMSSPVSRKTSIKDVDQRLPGTSIASAEETRHHQTLGDLRISTNDLRLEQSPEPRTAWVLKWMQGSQESIVNQSCKDDTVRKETIQTYPEGPHRSPVNSNIYVRSKVASSGHYRNLRCTCRNTAIEGNGISSAHLNLESAASMQSGGTRKKAGGRYKSFQRKSALGQSRSLSYRHGAGDHGKRSVIFMQTTGDDSKPRTGDTEGDLDPTTLISSESSVFSSIDNSVLFVDQKRLRKRQTTIMTDGLSRKDVSRYDDTEKAFSAEHAHGGTDTSESLTSFDGKSYQFRNRNFWDDCEHEQEHEHEQTNMNVSKNANTTERLPADVSKNSKSHPVYDDPQPSETITGRNESCNHGRDRGSDKTAAVVSLAVQENNSNDVKTPARDRKHRQQNFRICQDHAQHPPHTLLGASKAMFCESDGQTRVPSQDASDNHCLSGSSVKNSGTHQRQSETSASCCVIRHGEEGDCAQFFGDRKTFAYVKKKSDILSFKLDISSVGDANREKNWNPRSSKKLKKVTSSAMVDKSPASSICSAVAGKNFNECYCSSLPNPTNNDHNLTQAAASHENSQSDQSSYISCWSDASHSMHSQSTCSSVDATVSDVLKDEGLSEQIQRIVCWYVTTIADRKKHAASFQTKTAIEHDLKENIRTTIHEYIMNLVLESTRAADSQKASSFHRHINTENNQPLGENIRRMAHQCITEITHMAHQVIVSETMASLGVGRTNSLDGSTCLAANPFTQDMKVVNKQRATLIEKKLRRILCHHVKDIISQVHCITVSASPARIDSPDNSSQAGPRSSSFDTFSSTNSKVNREKSDLKLKENSRSTPHFRKEITGEEIPATACNVMENGTVVKNSKRLNIGESESHECKQDSIQTPDHLRFSKQHSAQTLSPRMSSHQHSTRMPGQLLSSKQQISRNDGASPEIQFIKGQHPQRDHSRLEGTNGAHRLDGKMQTTITIDGRTQRPEVTTSTTEERRGDSRERLNKNQHWLRPRNLRINTVRDDEIGESSAFHVHHGRPQSQAINRRANAGSRQSDELRNDRSPSPSPFSSASIKATSTNVHVECQDSKINKLTRAEKENLKTFRRDKVFHSKQSSERRPGFDNRKTLETKQLTSLRPVQTAVQLEKAKSLHLFDNETYFTSIDEVNADTVGVKNYLQRYQKDPCSWTPQAQDSIKSQSNTSNSAQDKTKTRDIVQDKSTNSETKPPKVPPHAQESVTENVRCSTRHKPASFTQRTGRKPSTHTARTGLRKRSSRHDKTSTRYQISTESLGDDKYDDFMSIASPTQTLPMSYPLEEWDRGFPVRKARHYIPATLGKDSVTAPQSSLLPLPCMGASSRPAQANKTTVLASSSAQTPSRNDPSFLGANDSHTASVAPAACPLNHSLSLVIPDDVFSLGTSSEQSKALKKQRNTNAGSAYPNSSITSPPSVTIFSQTIGDEQGSPSFEIHVPLCPCKTKKTAKEKMSADCVSTSVGVSCKVKKDKESASASFILEKDIFPACAVRAEKTKEDDIFLSISCCSDSFEQTVETTEVSLLDVKKNIPKPQAARERNYTRCNKHISLSLKNAATGKKRWKSRGYKVDTVFSPLVHDLASTSKSYRSLPDVSRTGEKSASSPFSSSNSHKKVINGNNESVSRGPNTSTIQSKGKRLTESEEDVRERIAQARYLLSAQEKLMILNRKFQEILRQTLVSMRDEMFKEEERWKKAQSRKALKNQRQKNLIEASKKIAQTAMSEALKQLQTRLYSIEEEACAHVKGELWDKTISNNSVFGKSHEQESNNTSVHTWNSKCSGCKVELHPTKKRSAVCTCSHPRISYSGRYDLSRTTPQPPRDYSTESFLSASIYSFSSKSQNRSNRYSLPSFKKGPTRQCSCSRGHSLKWKGGTISGWSSSGCNISRHFNNNWNSTSSRRKRRVYRIYSELALNTKGDTKKFNVPYRLQHRSRRTVACRSRKSSRTRNVDRTKSSIQMSSKIRRLELSNDKDKESSSKQKLMRIHNSFFKDLKKLAKRIAKDGAQSCKKYLSCMSDGGSLKNQISEAKYLLSLKDVSRIAAAVSMTAADMGLTNQWRRLSSFVLNSPTTLHHLTTDRCNSRRVASKKFDFTANKNKSAEKSSLGMHARRQINCRPRPVASSGTASFLSLTYCDSNGYVTGKSTSRSDFTSTDYNSVLDSSVSSLCCTSRVSSTITLHGQFSSKLHDDAADPCVQSSSLSISIVGCSARLRKNSGKPSSHKPVSGSQVNPGYANSTLDKSIRMPSSPRKIKVTIKPSSSSDCKQHHHQKQQQQQEQQQQPPDYFDYNCRCRINTDLHDRSSELSTRPSYCSKHWNPQDHSGEARTRTLCYRLPHLRENQRREDGPPSPDLNTSRNESQKTDFDSSSTRRMLITMIEENMSGRGRLHHMSSSRHMSYGQMLIANSNVLRNMRMTKYFGESTLQSLYKDAVYQYYLQRQHRRHCGKDCKGRN